MANNDNEGLSPDTLQRMRVMSRKLLQVVPTELSQDAQSWCNHLVKAIIHHYKEPADQLARARTLHFNLKKNGRRLAHYAPEELAQLSSEELCQGTNTQFQRERAQLKGWNPPPTPKAILAAAASAAATSNNCKENDTNSKLSGWASSPTRKLVLVLHNKGNYQAYKEYFEGTIDDNNERIKVVYGDILDEQFGDYDALVSPSNTMGNMDGGIDRIYADFLGWGYGRPYDQPNPLQIAIDQHVGEENARLDVGKALLVRNDNDGSNGGSTSEEKQKKKNNKHLIAAPTMVLPSKIKVNSTIIRDATLAAFQVWRQNSDMDTIRMPSFGTGYGQVPGTVAAAQTLEAFVLAWK